MTNEKIQEMFGQVPYFADTRIESAPQEKSPFKIYESWNSNGSIHHFENSINLKNTRRNKERKFLADEVEHVLLPVLHHSFRRFLSFYREFLA